jgi:hypothetical protein
MKCIFGPERAQIEHLNRKNNDFITKITNSQFNHRMARRAYSMCYIPSMLYSLVATSLREIHIDKIQQKAMMVFIRIMGFEKNFPRAVIFGPKKYGGIGLQKLSVDSNTNKIEAIMCHLNNATDLGDVILICLNLLQLHSGSAIPVLTNQNILDYIEPNWFDSVCELLIMTGATLIIHELWVPKLYRENDYIIMDKIEKTSLSRNQIKIFNSWRLYFQINSASEIINFSGDKIRNEYMKISDRSEYSSSSQILWPIQEIPHRDTFKIWLKGIKEITECDLYGNISNKLGHWKCDPAKTHNYNDLIHESKNHILIKKGRKWQKHAIQEKLGSTINFNETIDEILEQYDPKEYSAINIVHKNGSISVNTQDNMIMNSERIERRQMENTFQDFIYTGVYRINSILENLILYEEEKLFKKSTLLIACDGSAVDNEKGSFGISVAINQEIVATIKSKIPKIYGNLASFRSECYGILASTYLYNKIINFAQQQNKNYATMCRIICDNEAIIDTINKLQRVPSTTKQHFNPDADIIQETLWLINNNKHLGGKMKYQHIKGHQDKKQEKLSFEAKLNVMADQLGNDAMHLPQVEYYSMPHSKAELYLDNLIITKNHKQCVKDAYNSIAMRSYYQDKYGWNNKLTDNIWWLIHGKAFPSFNASIQTTIIKYIHGRLPCNHRENRYYEYRSNICSICKTNIETQEHVIQCNGIEENIILKKHYVRNLYRIMEANKTNAELARVIGVSVSAWINGEDMPGIKEMTDNPPKYLVEAYNEQKRLGWDQFLKGRLSIKWGFTYNQYRATDNTKKKFLNAEKWGKDIIVVGWKFVMDIWRNRNNVEHGDEINKVELKKKKLSKKLIGYKNKIRI